MTTDETEYEIIYTLRRRMADEEDFSDIGFSTSGAWTSPEQCAHIVTSDIQNYRWETEGDMPDPGQIKADLEGTDS